MNKLAQNLRTLASTIESIASEMETTDVTPKANEPITLEQVRAVLAEKSQSGKQPEVKALITSFGAKKLTDIDPSKYEELLKKAGDI